MANPLRTVTNRFMSKTANELETATARRTELEEQIAAQEKLIQEVSLQAVKGGMSEADVEAYRGNNGKLIELRGLLDACDRWIGELHEAERHRQHEAQIKVNKTRLNALTQQVRKFDRLEAEHEKNVKSLVSNWIERQELAKAIGKLVPFNDWLNNNCWDRFKSTGMRQAEAREIVRQGYLGQGDVNYTGIRSHVAAEELKTFAIGPIGYEELVSSMPGMPVEGKANSDWALREFAKSLGLWANGSCSPVSVPTPVSKPAPAAPALVSTQPHNPFAPGTQAYIEREAELTASFATPTPPFQRPHEAPIPVSPPHAAPPGPASKGNLWDHVEVPRPPQSVLDQNAERTLASLGSGPINAHPPGSSEHAEFEAAMAAMAVAGGSRSSAADYLAPPAPAYTPPPPPSVPEAEFVDTNVDPASLLPPGASFGGSLVDRHQHIAAPDQAAMDAAAERTLNSISPKGGK